MQYTETIVDCLKGGDYLFLVKGNQPQLFEELRLLFAPLSPAKRAGEGVLRLLEQHAQTTEKAHGRLDIRSSIGLKTLKPLSGQPKTGKMLIREDLCFASQ